MGRGPTAKFVSVPTAKMSAFATDFENIFAFYLAFAIWDIYCIRLKFYLNSKLSFSQYKKKGSKIKISTLDGEPVKRPVSNLAFCYLAYSHLAI